MVALVGIRLHLDSTVDTDRVGDPLLLLPRVRLASLGTGRGVAERAAARLVNQNCISPETWCVSLVVSINLDDAQLDQLSKHRSERRLSRGHIA